MGITENEAKLVIVREYPMARHEATGNPLAFLLGISLPLATRTENTHVSMLQVATSKQQQLRNNSFAPVLAHHATLRRCGFAANGSPASTL